MGFDSVDRDEASEQAERGANAAVGVAQREISLLTGQLAAAMAAAREADAWGTSPPILDPAHWRGPAAGAQDLARARAVMTIRRAVVACDELVSATRLALAALDG